MEIKGASFSGSQIHGLLSLHKALLPRGVQAGPIAPKSAHSCLVGIPLGKEGEPAELSEGQVMLSSL